MRPLPRRRRIPSSRAARESGLLDTETALLYELYEALEPESLPSEYRDENPGPRGCATPLILDALEARDGGSPEYGSALAKTLARPTRSHQVLSPSGRFRIHYDIEGEHAVDPADADNNGVPDYVDVTAAAIDSIWHLEVEVLGYDPPPTDGTLGGGGEYDIYIEQILGGYYGFTQPEGSGPRKHSYLRIDNNYEEEIFGRASSCEGARGARELTALRVTLAHEFFHMIQFGYFQGSEGIWWQESSATWMEEVAYPEADDYLQYLCDFIRSPERSLESHFPGGRRIYGSAIFSHFLDQRYGRQVVREIWEEHRRRESASLGNFHRASPALRGPRTRRGRPQGLRSRRGRQRVRDLELLHRRSAQGGVLRGGPQVPGHRGGSAPGSGAKPLRTAAASITSPAPTWRWNPSTREV